MSTIVITGVSGGLGGFLAEQLASQHTVIGTYHNRTIDDPQRVGGNVHLLDVTDAAQVQAFVDEVRAKLDRVVLVNMAGISLDAMGHKMPEELWDRVVDTNLKGVFLMSRALLPVMREQKWGRIINISSVVGQVGIPGTAAYAASKAGVIGLTRTLASENVTNNITVNALALGYFSVGIMKDLKPEIQDLIIQKIPMHRLGDPTNVAAAVRFLIDADYVTGTTININGGLLS